MRSFIASIVALVAQLGVLALVASAQPSEQPLAAVVQDELFKTMEKFSNDLKGLEIPNEMKELKREVASLREAQNVIELPREGPGYVLINPEFGQKGLLDKIPGVEEKCEEYGAKIHESLEKQGGRLIDTSTIYLAWKANKGNPKIVAKNPQFFELVEVREACCSIKKFSYCIPFEDSWDDGVNHMKRFEKDIDRIRIPEEISQIEGIIKDYADQWNKPLRLVELVFGKDREYLYEQTAQSILSANENKEFKETCNKFSRQVKAMAVATDVDFDRVVFRLVKNRSLDNLDDFVPDLQKYLSLREACLRISQLLPDEDNEEEKEE